VAWPLRAHYGEVWADLKGSSPFQILDTTPLEEIEYISPIPLRTQNFQGASFYAVIGSNVPYRFFQDIDLETLKVFRVKKYDRNAVVNDPITQALSRGERE